MVVRSFPTRFWFFGVLAPFLDLWTTDPEQEISQLFFCGGTVQLSSAQLVDKGRTITGPGSTLDAEVNFTSEYSTRHASRQAVIVIQVPPSGHIHKF